MSFSNESESDNCSKQNKVILNNVNEHLNNIKILLAENNYYDKTRINR